MRLIDADALLRFVDYGRLRNPHELAFSEHDVKTAIDNAPTIDAVKVVRCKDCENWDTEWQPVLCKSNRVVHYCPILDRVTAENMFCAYGERRENG